MTVLLTMWSDIIKEVSLASFNFNYTIVKQRAKYKIYITPTMLIFPTYLHFHSLVVFLSF